MLLSEPSTPTTTNPASGAAPRRHRGEHALGELDEPGRVAPLVVVPRDDLHLRPVDDARQPASKTAEYGEPITSEETSGSSL